MKYIGSFSFLAMVIMHIMIFVRSISREETAEAKE